MNVNSLARTGLVAVPDFLTPDVCATLRAEMLSGAGNPAVVPSEVGRVVGEDICHVKSVSVAKELRSQVKARLVELLPKSEIRGYAPMAG